MTPRRQAALGAFVCVVLPLASWVADGRGAFAYTMYSETVSYRLEVSAIDAAGARSPMDLARVAAELSSPAAPFVDGAGALRTVATVDVLRDHLADVARAACRAAPGEAIEITLYERRDDGDGEARPTRVARVQCPGRG